MKKSPTEESGGVVKTTAKRKLKPGMGKAKGNSFENTISKKLSEALKPLKFIRTQGSGARVGGKNFETLGQMFGEEALKLFVGDVVPVNEKEACVSFNFSVECKFYKTPDQFTALVSGTANIYKWMQESVVDAAKISKIPMLVFKWNNTAVFVAIPSGYKLSEKVKPDLVVNSPAFSDAIDIYKLDDLLQVPDFWITKIE